jgi:REP element-mobilizing transposase RayT
VHKHLNRIPVWLPPEKAVIYFVTCCTAERQRCLARPPVHDAIRAAWQRLPDWRVGRYVVMPDHVHFFVMPADRQADLSKYSQAFRSLVTRQLRPRGFLYPLWQREFFDHLLRSDESYEQKWQYVRLNPVRAGLVAAPEEWPYAGEIHPLEV